MSPLGGRVSKRISNIQPWSIRPFIIRELSYNFVVRLTDKMRSIWRESTLLTACSLCANSRVNFLRQSASEYVPFLYQFYAQHRQDDGTKKGTPLAQMTERGMVVDISRLASSCLGAPSGDILTLPALLPLLVVFNLPPPPPLAMSLRGGAEKDTENPQDLPAHFAVCQAPPVPFGPLTKAKLVHSWT